MPAGKPRVVMTRKQRSFIIVLGSLLALEWIMVCLILFQVILPNLYVIQQAANITLPPQLSIRPPTPVFSGPE
jgi:hypothetical protein